ncbi:hypothetical protein [Streptomyces sp. NPDC057623]|uniref:hypothetical protein n=1 Tax=Streptomyces sp. NPDC057623 TaxID=3346187 RepID=UPI0036B9B89B
MDIRTEPARARPEPGRIGDLEGALLGWATTTNHKAIGNLFMMTAIGFFLLGRVLALFFGPNSPVPDCSCNHYHTRHPAGWLGESLNLRPAHRFWPDWHAWA